MQQYMLKSHHHLFKYLGYSHACAVFASVAAALATFSWNFMDLFIAVTSIALTERFHLLNRNLQAVRGKVTALYRVFQKSLCTCLNTNIFLMVYPLSVTSCGQGLQSSDTQVCRPGSVYEQRLLNRSVYDIQIKQALLYNFEVPCLSCKILP